MKIYIIGSPGSGKTTLAKKLSKKLNIKYYELDLLVYDDKNNHIKRTNKEIELLFNKILKRKSWIIEDVGRDIFIQGKEKADKIYYLKINKITRYKRIIKRWYLQNKGKEKYNFPPTIKQLLYYLKITNGYLRKEKYKLEKLNEYKDKLEILEKY